MSAAPALTRRDFLAVSLTAAGGLLATFKFASAAPTEPFVAPDGLGVFVRIDPSNRVTIGAPGAEIGQGVKTSLPMLIAEELDVAWSDVTVEQLPLSLLPSDQPPGVRWRYGGQGAGGSTNIPGGWTDLRPGGARVRRMFVEAAAERWQVDAATLSTRDGHVVHPDGRRLSYGELASEAAQRPIPDGDVALKDPADFRIVGSPRRMVDAERIVQGAEPYGIDARLDGALVAVIARCPYFDGSLGRVDDSAARKVPGVRDVVTIPGPSPEGPITPNLAAGVAVLAEDTWSALKGRDALVIEWRKGPWADDSTDALRQRCLEALDVPGTVARDDGDVDREFGRAERVIEAVYEMPFLAHATLEPPNALVRIDKDRALVIASLQSPGGASRVVHQLTGIPRLDIEVRLPRSGGGFGRRLENDFVAEAVLIAQAAKRPVRLIWTREDDLAHDYFRFFGLHRLRAALDQDGRVSAWHHKVAGTSRIWRSPGREDDPIWTGLVDEDGYPAGTVANLRNEFTPVDFGLARGWWRGPVHTFVTFAIESFVDELAHASGRDPLELRLALIGAPRELDYRGHGGPKFDTGRLAGVLRLAADRIGWGRQLPAGRGLGLACHFTFGGYAAHAMEVSVDAREGLRIHRCICAIDVGQPVNPLGIEAQAMGATIDGLSAALGQAITVRAGRVEQSNFDTYKMLRSRDAPDVEVAIVSSTATPSGAGEMGIPTAAPALANAIYAATGRRLRGTPLGLQLAGQS
jgi:isoquinoline 1-oxidoreductase beta subunit